jgi:hypothetical protein
MPILGRKRRRGIACNEDVRKTDGLQIFSYREYQFTAEVYVQQGEVHLLLGEHLSRCVYGLCRADHGISCALDNPG